MPDRQSIHPNTCLTVAGENSDCIYTPIIHPAIPEAVMTNIMVGSKCLDLILSNDATPADSIKNKRFIPRALDVSICPVALIYATRSPPDPTPSPESIAIIVAEIAFIIFMAESLFGN